MSDPDFIQHIGTLELAKLLEASRRSPQSAVDAHPHLAACPTCREQFDELALLDRQLRNMRPVGSALHQVECPGPEVWREMAGGLTSSSETLAYVEHASCCDHCGALLRGAVAECADLNAEISETERKQISALASARTEWQHMVARRISGTDREATRPWQRWLAVPGRTGRLAVAGISLLAVVGLASWVVVRSKDHLHQPAAVQALMARAYTEKRTLELRITGAEYAPLRVSLGPAASFTSRPAPLLEAEALIASQLALHPTDPAWLQAKAQADVLEGKYEAAVETLRHALQLDPRSSAILTDLATACFQRAQQEDRKEDFGTAYEYLSQALNLRPDDPVALFNRAIVAEHQFLYHQALDDWERYLRIDSNSHWSEEARSRANAVRERLKQHESKMTPLLSPSQLAAQSANAELASEVDDRIEEYLHEAVRSWLQEAFPERRAEADSNAARSLFFLADLTTRQHGDLWLADLLRGSSSPHFPQAATALVLAVKANDAGEYGVSRQQAVFAEKMFRASGNTAGVLRAKFEQSFADQFSRHGEECRRESIKAGAEAKRYSYPWVQIQLGLEVSVCSILMGDLGTFERAAFRAQERAQQARYDPLHLRALGFMAESKFEAGDRSSGWKFVIAGLEQYWSRQFPAMRGYNLYVQGAIAAEAAGNSNLRLALWRESAATIDSNENLLLRADAHGGIANAASAAQQPDVAKHQYEEAAKLYALAPQTDATRANRLENEILTAQLETDQGAFDSALSRLTRVEDEVRRLSDNFLAQMLYSTLGKVQLRSHRAVEAEQAFRPALRLAEQNLASLSSESDRTTWSKDAGPIYLGLAEAELVQGRDQESLEMFEWYLGAPQRVGSRGRVAPETTPEPSQSLSDPSRLAARLPLLSNQTVLAYGVLPDGLAIWVYDDRGVSAKWIPKPLQDLQDLASNFYFECSDPNSEVSALRRDSQILYSLLIAPVAQRLDPKRTLVIETEGFLARLPFEALMDANGHYLIERGPIVHSSGLYADARIHPDTEISPELPALVVGSAASSPDAGLFAIPNVPAGAEAVASGFHSARVLKGPEATLSAVTNALPAAAVFHFAGHAITTSSHTGLMLAGRAKDAPDHTPLLLDATILRHLNLQNMRLAVLAACSTDSGEGGTRGFDSIAEALQTSGVPHVVASRWAIDSVEANGYVDYFYRSLLSGQPVSSATRLTSIKLLLNSRTAHPYYWAAFAAYGRP